MYNRSVSSLDLEHPGNEDTTMSMIARRLRPATKVKNLAQVLSSFNLRHESVRFCPYIIARVRDGTIWAVDQGQLEEIDGGCEIVAY